MNEWEEQYLIFSFILKKKENLFFRVIFYKSCLLNKVNKLIMEMYKKGRNWIHTWYDDKFTKCF